MGLIQSKAKFAIIYIYIYMVVYLKSDKTVGNRRN